MEPIKGERNIQVQLTNLYGWCHCQMPGHVELYNGDIQRSTTSVSFIHTIGKNQSQQSAKNTCKLVASYYVNPVTKVACMAAKCVAAQCNCTATNMAHF